MKTTLMTALATAAAAAGTITINNACSYGVAYQIDAQGTTGRPKWLNAYSGNIEELAGEPGQAIKFSPTGDFSRPISFDYTVNKADGKVYYDVSDVAGHPLDVFVTPARLECQVVACSSKWPLSVCNQPRTCGADASYNVDLCSPAESSLENQRLRQHAKMGEKMI